MRAPGTLGVAVLQPQLERQRVALPSAQKRIMLNSNAKRYEIFRRCRVHIWGAIEAISVRLTYISDLDSPRHSWTP